MKDRKSNRLHPSIRRRELPVNGLLDVVEDGMERSLGQAKAGVALGRQFSGLRKGGFREADNREVGRRQNGAHQVIPLLLGTLEEFKDLYDV